MRIRRPPFHGLLARRLFAALALLAMLVRGVVPVGAMPIASAPGPEGATPIVICAGGFAKTIWLDADGKKVDGPAGESAGHVASPCAFCGLTVALPDTVPILIAVPIEIVAVAAVPRDAPLAHAQTLRLLPDSHGPPRS